RHAGLGRPHARVGVAKELPSALARARRKVDRDALRGYLAHDAGVPYADTADENVLALGVGVAGHAGTSTPHVSTAASTGFARRVAAPGVRQHEPPGRPSCQTTSTPRRMAASYIGMRSVRAPT